MTTYQKNAITLKILSKCCELFTQLNKIRSVNQPFGKTQQSDDNEALKSYKKRFTKTIVKYDDGVYIRHNTNMCL